MNRSRLLLENILDARAGINEDYVVPDTTSYIDLSHLEEEPTPQAAGGGSDDDRSFMPPGDSGGFRQPARGSATSYRSWAHVPEYNRLVNAESRIEMRVRDTLLGDRDLVDLRDQWPRVVFLMPDGQVRHHIFDYCARYRSGRIDLIAVKPLDRIERERLDGRPSLAEAMRLIQEQGEHRAYGHRVVVLSEKEVSDDQVHNADRLREARRYRHEPDVAEARVAMELLGPRFRFHELLQGAEDRWRRAQAIWGLIDDRILVPEEPGSVIDRSFLRVASENTVAP